MREDLVGYLLGALDGAEQQQIEERLESDAELRFQLERLEMQLAPLKLAAVEFEPPRGLAERTCQAVVQQAPVQQVAEPEAEHRERPWSLAGFRFSWPLPSRQQWSASSSWSLADLGVAAGVCMALAMLFFPAIASSRYTARMLACQNNLRQVGDALFSYSEVQKDRSFPYVPAKGNLAFAGVQPVILVEQGFLDDPDCLLCPGSEMAHRIGDVRMPTVAELERLRGGQLTDVQRTVGGSFAYSLGWVDHDGRHRAVLNQSRPNFTIMADAPSAEFGQRRSINHGGRGENVLLEDGHIRFMIGCAADRLLDDPFRNRRGNVEAGVDRDDAVIGPSSAAPFLRPTRVGR